MREQSGAKTVAAEIADRSFTLIRTELAERGISLPLPLATIVERIIHATADFEFASITKASPGAIAAGVAAVQGGCTVITDVQMVRAGIDRQRLQRFGGNVDCFNELPVVWQLAAETGLTRSAASLRWAHEQTLLQGAIVAIGNAPTALLELLHLLDSGAQPALIIGVPVGFVNTVESKAALMARTDVPWFATVGRKGGSPVATAIVNALLRLANGEDNRAV